MVRFIDNTCSDEELHTVERWLAESPENSRRLFELERTAMLAGSLRNDSRTRNRVYTKIKERIEKEEALRRRTRRLSFIRWGAAAAMIAGIAVMVKIFVLGPSVNMVTVAALGGNMEVTLPDSTHVWLNRDATLRYPETFAKTERKVELQGEAYFDVTRNPNRPFIVEGERMDVRVLGTQFNFNSSLETLSTVSLIEGSIEVTPRTSSDGIVLSPGQKATFDPKTGRMQIAQANTILDAVWRDGIIPFTNAPISEIAVTLEQMYGVRITILGDPSSSSTYSGGIMRYESIDSTLMMLCNTLPITYSVKGTEVTIAIK